MKIAKSRHTHKAGKYLRFESIFVSSTQNNVNHQTVSGRDEPIISHKSRQI